MDKIEKAKCVDRKPHCPKDCLTEKQSQGIKMPGDYKCLDNIREDIWIQVYSEEKPLTHLQEHE